MKRQTLSRKTEAQRKAKKKTAKLTVAAKQKLCDFVLQIPVPCTPNHESIIKDKPPEAQQYRRLEWHRYDLEGAIRTCRLPVPKELSTAKEISVDALKHLLLEADFDLQKYSYRLELVKDLLSVLAADSHTDFRQLDYKDLKAEAALRRKWAALPRETMVSKIAMHYNISEAEAKKWCGESRNYLGYYAHATCWICGGTRTPNKATKEKTDVDAGMMLLNVSKPNKKFCGDACKQEASRRRKQFKKWIHGKSLDEIKNYFQQAPPPRCPFCEVQTTDQRLCDKMIPKRQREIMARVARANDTDDDLDDDD